MACLYSISFPNGKQYIGLSSYNFPEARFKQHLYRTKSNKNFGLLYSAMRKYKVENLKFETLIIGNLEYIKQMEKKAIIAFNTTAPFGYNLSEGGETSPASNPEVAAKISKTKMGHSFTEEGRKNLSKGQFSRFENIEEKRKISKTKREILNTYQNVTTQTLYKKTIELIQTLIPDFDNDYTNIEIALNHGISKGYVGKLRALRKRFNIELKVQNKTTSIIED